jgi:hypothetical protein
MQTILDYPVLTNVFLGLLVLGGMLGTTIFGHRAGIRYLAGAHAELKGLGAIEGAIFALFGLLLAFTFTGAAERFQNRKALTLQEAQAISTAWSRLDLLPEGDRRDLREAMREYLQARLRAYSDPGNRALMERRLNDAEEVGAGLAARAAAACRAPESKEFAEVVLQPINEVLDIATARTAALTKHPPLVIYLLLLLLAMLSGFLAGFSMAPSARLSRVHVAAFAATIALTLCVTYDIEHPRAGLVRVDDTDKLLVHVLDSMR